MTKANLNQIKYIIAITNVRHTPPVTVFQNIVFYDHSFMAFFSLSNITLLFEKNKSRQQLPPLHSYSNSNASLLQIMMMRI